jgi:hypothetical protein
VMDDKITQKQIQDKANGDHDNNDMRRV